MEQNFELENPLETLYHTRYLKLQALRTASLPEQVIGLGQRLRKPQRREAFNAPSGGFRISLGSKGAMGGPCRWSVLNLKQCFKFKTIIIIVIKIFVTRKQEALMVEMPASFSYMLLPAVLSSMFLLAYCIWRFFILFPTPF